MSRYSIKTKLDHDYVKAFIANANSHELAFLMEMILTVRGLVWDGNRMLDVESVTLNGLCFQINTNQEEENDEDV